MIDRDQQIQQFIDTIALIVRGAKSHFGHEQQLPELGQAEISILFRLSKTKEGMTVSDLADSMGVSKSAITQIIDKLVEKKMINRIRTNEDRRIVQLELSKKAHSVLGEVRRCFCQQLKPYFNDLSDSEISQLVTLVSKIKVVHKEN